MPKSFLCHKQKAGKKLFGDWCFSRLPRSFRLLNPKAWEQTFFWYSQNIVLRTKQTVYENVCVRGINCPLDCMETYTRMGIKEPWATLNMSERTHSLFYIVTLAGTLCFEYRYTQNEINSNMYLYKLLFIVVLMLRNPKTVKKLQYGQIFLKESHFWWWGGNLGMDRGVKFLVFDNFLNVCTIWMSTLGMRVCFPTLFWLKPPRTYLECLKL